MGSDTTIKENIGSIKRLGMVIKGVDDNTLLHVRTEGRNAEEIEGEVEGMVPVKGVFFVYSFTWQPAMGIILNDLIALPV